MALAWLAAARACVDDVDGAKRAYAELRRHPDKGRVDKVLARKAAVAESRSSAQLSKLALFELLLMTGHVQALSQRPEQLRGFLDLYRPIQHSAEARYEPGRKNARAREELAAACLAEGALLQHARPAPSTVLHANVARAPSIVTTR